MLETHRAEAFTTPPHEAVPPVERPQRYCGPDRRRQASVPRDWLGAALDELDYGVLVLAPDGEILHLNRAAEIELAAGQPLRRTGGRLQACGAADALLLQGALRNASQRRLRKLLSLGEADQHLAVSVVPLGTACPTSSAAGGSDAVTTLLVFGKRQVCESLSMQGFAGSFQLTNAETRVLGALCGGLPPVRIAKETGVAISTVRTHIGTIRVKTGAESIRALVAKVARLPPLMSALRHLPAGSAAKARENDEARAWMQ